MPYPLAMENTAAMSPPPSREMLLAWHLRDDIRAGRSLDDPDTQADFHLWWLCSAHREFPAVATLPCPEDVVLASEIVTPAAGDGDVPVTRLMDFVWRLRATDTAAFDRATIPGRRAFAAWFYASAVPEMELFHLLDDRQRQWLLGPVGASLAPVDLALPRLAWLTWESRDDVRTTIDAHGPQGPLSLLIWYYVHGATEMRHGGYFARQPATALFTEPPGLPGISRLGLLAWLGDDAARAQFDPATPHGLAGLLSWLADSGLVERARPILLAPAQTRPARPAKAPPPRRPFGVNIIGYARGELGIGEDARMCALSLAASEVPFAVVNLPVGSNTREADGFLDACLDEDLPFPVNIFCLTGLDTVRLWLERGEALFAERKNIGYWPWELPAWPEAMADAYGLVDEVWVSSAYTRDAFAKTSPVPVRVMPMAVSVDRMTPRGRLHFGLPEDRFLFLYTFDCNSYLARKNPLAAIHAFRTAFPRPGEPVSLVLKTMNARNDDPRFLELAREAAADPQIIFLEGTFDRGEVLGLFAACDAYVSPHRAEGFGRTLAEAMLLGKPVIATAHSGNADFLTPRTGFPVPYRFVSIGSGEYPFGLGLTWADPDLRALASAMRLAVSAPAAAAIRAAAGRDLVATRHHPLTVGRAYRRRLEELHGL